MPLVEACFKGRVNPGDQLTCLRLALDQLIPATYSTDDHPVTPGGLTPIPSIQGCRDLPIDVLIMAKGRYFVDRAEIITDRAGEAKQALRELFPGYTFEVLAELIHAGWVSDFEDPAFKGDLSMPAAIERAKEAIQRARLGRPDPS